MHQAAENQAMLANLRVSKYVQSRIEDTYYKVKKTLESDRQVLFVGTPCQCVALKRYLKKEYANVMGYRLPKYGGDIVLGERKGKK